MSFQAYLDSIEAKTGKTVAEFRALADEKKLTKHGEIVKWLRADFELGHGHATAVAAALLKADHFKTPTLEKVEAVFSGKKASWKPIYDTLWAAVQGFGDDVGLAPTDSYVSFIRGPKRSKFAIVQPGAGHLDLGLKRKAVDATERFEAAGNWNSMVTHRVRITDAAQIDAELLNWLQLAYEG